MTGTRTENYRLSQVRCKKDSVELTLINMAKYIDTLDTGTGKTKKLVRTNEITLNETSQRLGLINNFTIH